MEGTGMATVSVEFTTTADTTIGGAFFRIDLPHEYYSEGRVQLIDPAEVSLAETDPSGQQVYLRVPAGGVRFVSPLRQLEVTFSETTEVMVQRGEKLPARLTEARWPLLCIHLTPEELLPASVEISASRILKPTLL